VAAAAADAAFWPARSAPACSSRRWSSRSSAFQIVLIATFLPSFILSGFIFPISSMPVVIQAVTHIVPARYFLSALRASC
jgi:hypothetical protein